MLLTGFFVILEKFLIWTPSIARYRKVYLEENIAQAGMTLLGRVVESDGHNLTIAPDLKVKVAQADQCYRDRMTAFDEYIRKALLDVSETDDSNTDDGAPTDGPDLEERLELDLVEREIAAIIWSPGSIATSIGSIRPFWTSAGIRSSSVAFQSFPNCTSADFTGCTI